MVFVPIFTLHILKGRTTPAACSAHKLVLGSCLPHLFCLEFDALSSLWEWTEEEAGYLQHTLGG